MDSFLIFWILIIILTIGLVVGFIYLGYWIPKRLGKKKLGQWISGILTVAVLVFLLSFVFEDQLFFKSDAKRILTKHNIELKDDFKLSSNKITGIGDLYHRFELKISENDKERIKEKIITSNNYQHYVDELFDLRQNKPRHSDKEQNEEFTANYQNEMYYIYEYYRPNEKGYKPTFDRISISKEEDKLIYESISE